MNQSGEITIVGAGPAGLACAIVLARAGRRVVVRERHESVGARFHGDFQGIENWSDETDVLEELAASGINSSLGEHPVYRGAAFDAWGKRYYVESEKPLFYLVSRGSNPGSLDQHLLREARDAGVEVRFNDRVERIEGPAVLATGPRVADAIAVGYVFETDMADGTWICVDDKLAPRGYAYLLTHGGRGTMANCFFAGFKREKGHLARTVAAFRERVGLEMRNPRPFGGFTNIGLARTAMQGGRPVIGEQAGFQDALAGFGLRYAFRSAALAARSFIEGVEYRRLWRAELLPLVRASITNRYIFDVVGDRGRRWMIEHRLSKGDTRVRLRSLYRPSLRTRLLFPLARWRQRVALRDESCDHVDCTCVWCRCKSGASARQCASECVASSEMAA